MAIKDMEQQRSRLREKIEDNPAAPAYILTRRGVGYYFSAQA